MGRKKKRPLGITILGIYILLLALVAFVMALDYMEGWNLSVLDDQSLITDFSPFILGIVYLLLGISRFGVGIGVFLMKRTAWSGAFFIISIGMFFDMLNGHLFAFIAGLLALFYLIASKKKFTYR